jgi:hypothetical protein
MTPSLLLLSLVLSAEARAAENAGVDGGSAEFAAPGLLGAVDAGVPVQNVHEATPVVTIPAPGPPPHIEGTVKLRGAAEADFSSFPSGISADGAQDLFLDLRPMFGIDAGDDFGIELGAEFRLRVFDDPPAQRADDIGGVLRRKDWDEASDFGQIIRALRIGRGDSVLWVQAGAVRKKTLGLGHLISRYSNQDNPDYHPASASVGVAYKAFRGEFFASDLFGARLFAGELALDLGRIIGSTEAVYDRFHLAFSLAHDAGQAGGIAPQATLLELDFDAVLYRNSAVRIMALTGLGSRVQGTADVGLVAGLSVDATLEGAFSIGGKLELRKQAGGFRQGFFGPGYELARFAGAGLSGAPRAQESLPDAFSVYGELHLASGDAVSVDLSLEHFSWGRTDTDVLFSLAIIDHRLVGAARFTGTGLGVSLIDASGPIAKPRYAMTTELRLRLFSSFYVLAAGGTVFFPQPDSTLVRGIYAGAGAGVDFER